MVADPHSLELIREVVDVLNGCIIGVGYDIADRPGGRVVALQARTSAVLPKPDIDSSRRFRR